MKKSLTVVVTAGMTAVALLGVTACKESEEAFKAPENVSVAGSVLSWDAAEGASSGYTVRVGSDETKTVTVSASDAETVTLSLAEGKIVEYFASGANELSVKVNATDKKSESAYSKAVTYNYTPASPVKTPLNAPSDVKAENGVLSWGGVSGATQGYTVKINGSTLTVTETSLSLTSDDVKALFVRGENKISVKANATDVSLESVYSAEISYSYTPEKSPLDTPVNVKVENGTLSWSAVDGAAQGYTVKINEGSLTAEGTSLDLTDDSVKALLVRGKNTLSVKANATDDALESAFSATAEYTYVIAAQDEADEFRAAVDAVDLSADGAAEKLASAKAKYAVLSQEAAALSSEAVASLKTKDAAYFGSLVDAVATVGEDSDKTAIEGAESAVSAAKAYTVIEGADVAEKQAELTQKENALSALKNKIDGQVASLEEKVNAAVSAKTAEQSVSALQTAVDEAKAVVLCDAAKSVEAEKVSGLQEKITECETALTAWNAEISSAREKLTVTFNSEDTDEAAEENIATAERALEGYAEYPAYVKTAVETEHETVVGAQNSAKEKIGQTVSALRQEITDANLTGTISAEKLNRTYYEQLVGYQSEIERLGAYGKTLWDGALTEKVETEISVLLATAVKTEKGESPVLINHQTQTNAVYVIRRYVNVIGEPIEFESLPALLVSDDAETSLAEGSVTLDEETGSYVFRIAFTRPAETAVTVTYRIGDEEEVSVKIGTASQIIYGTAVQDGKFTCSEAINTVYLDVYESSAISYGEDGGEKDVLVSGAPLATKLEIRSGTSEDSLRSLLARAGILGEHDLALIAYQTKNNEDGSVSYTNINEKSVATYSCTLTEEDVKLRLNFTSVALEINEGGITFGGGGLSAEFTGNLTAMFTGAVQDSEVTLENLKDYVRYYIDVTYNGKTERIYLDSNLNIGSDGVGYSHVDAKLIKAEIFKQFGVVENGEFTLNVGFALSEQAEAVYGDFLRDSLPVAFTKTYTVGNEKLANSWALDVQDASNANCLGFKWEVITANAPFCDEAEILVFRVSENGEYSPENALATYVKNGAGFIEWSAVDDALIRAWGALSDKQNTESFVFAVRALVNEAGRASGFVDSDLVLMQQDGEIYGKEYTQDWSIPTDAQMFFREQGEGVICVAQVKPNSDGRLTRNGEAFTGGGTAYVEVKLTKEGADDIVLYLFAEEGALKLYKEISEGAGAGNALSCAIVTDGWVNVGDVNAWMGDSFDIKEWAISTKIVANDSGFYTDYPDGSDGWSEPESWENRDAKTA